MSSWGAFFASHGYVAMTIGPNDEINDSHYQRGEGLIDGIETNIELHKKILSNKEFKSGGVAINWLESNIKNL